MRRLHTGDASFVADFAALLGARGEAMDRAEEAARAVIAAVKARGMEAVREFSARFDGLDAATPLRVERSELEAALRACPEDLLDALRLARDRVERFHTREKPEDHAWEDEHGVRMGWRWTAMDAAGVYAPGGLAAYPSSVIMNIMPARVAGVKRIVLTTPPAKAANNPAVLAAASLCGVDEVWRIGGAQAIAALAYGAGELAPVDVIVGPGNAYVASAKRLVFGDVGVDSVAGPSEVFILADGKTDPAWIGADLLAQCEHDEDAQAILFTADSAFADAVSGAVQAQLDKDGGAHTARVSWQRHGAIVLVDRVEEAFALINQGAPEHLQITLDDAARYLPMVRHAGAVFLGRYAPEALGDYLAGPNHVLPTGRRARFSSGLSTMSFLKRTTVMSSGPEGLKALGPAGARLAAAEGLRAHERSFLLRLASLA
jgi:histidinol dehydrogenase